MKDLIKEINRQKKYAEQEYNFLNSNKNQKLTDIEKNQINSGILYWKAQMNAYNAILNYIKQEEL
jgi:hypothetical protein